MLRLCRIELSVADCRIPFRPVNSFRPESRELLFIVALVGAIVALLDALVVGLIVAMGLLILAGIAEFRGRTRHGGPKTH